MWVPVFVLCAMLLMLSVEMVRPGRCFRSVTGWWSRVCLLTTMQALIVFLAGISWEPWMHGFGLMSLGEESPVLGVLIGYLLITFVYYWWHRARHEVEFLWKWLHQIHHSPSRLEVFTTFYKHPLEMLINGLLTSALLYLVCGLSIETATYTILLTGLTEVFYHWNVSTPRWVGFLIQRPESHCIHHEVDVHHFNYSDLPLWDMLFGTFHNPGRFHAQCGFEEGAEQRLGEMLKGRSVTADHIPKGPRVGLSASNLSQVSD